MNNDHIFIRKSKIHNFGIFANRDFKKSKVVLKWKPKILKKSEIEKLSIKGKHYVYQNGNDYFLMQYPEKYVNHSCEANTEVKNQGDVAVRDIKKGEEITSDYSKEGSFVSFKCKCGSKICRGEIKNVPQ